MQKILLCCLLLALSNFGFAQKSTGVLGVVGGSHYYPDGLFDWTDNGKKTFSVSGGLFYDHTFDQDLGISISATHRVKKQEMRPLFGCFQCVQDTSAYRLDFNYIDFSVNAAVNINADIDAKWKSYLLFGYTYGYIYSLKKEDLATKEVTKVIMYHSSPHVHQGNLAYELRRNFAQNYGVGFEVQVRIEVEDFGSPYWGLNLKLGRRLF